MVEFVIDVTLHVWLLIFTWVFNTVAELLACKFWPVNVIVVGPLTDVGLTELIEGVTLDDHRYVQDDGKQMTVLVPTKIVIGIDWSR